MRRGGRPAPDTRPLPLSPGDYGVTFSITTLPAPAAVPRAFSSRTSPKN